MMIMQKQKTKIIMKKIMMMNSETLTKFKTKKMKMFKMKKMIGVTLINFKKIILSTHKRIQKSKKIICFIPFRMKINKHQIKMMNYSRKRFRIAQKKKMIGVILIKIIKLNRNNRQMIRPKTKMKKVRI